MSQKPRHSLAETLLNTASGFMISLAATWAVFPLFGIKSSPAQNLGVTLVYTIISVARSYAWRRVFNWLHLTGRLQ